MALSISPVMLLASYGVLFWQTSPLKQHRRVVAPSELITAIPPLFFIHALSYHTTFWVMGCYRGIQKIPEQYPTRGGEMI